jgi:SAM-dependent methyltransferase
MGVVRRARNAADLALYHMRGRRPWSRGYHQYKTQSIAAQLAAGTFTADALPPGYGFRLDERIVEYPWFFSRLPAAAAGTLLDAGSILNYDYVLAHSALREKRVFISTLAPEGWSFPEKGISYVFEDLRQTCFRDEYFDWVVCLSTIEHIGLDNTMLYTSDASKKEDAPMSCLDAVRQFRRVLKPAGRLYLSFPFGRHKNHGWFQIFDAPMVDQVIEAFGPGDVTEFHFRYEPDGWRTSSRAESKDATYFDIHTQKQYDPDFAAASRAIVCLEFVKG